MNEQQLRKSLKEISPTNEQKERMLNNILKQVEQKEVKDLDEAKKKVVPFTTRNRWLAVAASLLIVTGIGISTYDFSPQGEAIVDSPQQTSDMGMRKFMNYNGYRYAFSEENTHAGIQSGDLEKPLGKLDHQLTYGQTQDFAMDFATTYGVGGTIWAIKGYDPMFRVAVEADGEYYLCENVGRSNDSEMNLEEFFETIAVDERIEAVELSYQMNQKGIGRFEQKDSKDLFKALKESTFVYPEAIDFESLYSQDAIRKIIDIAFILDDDTRIKMFMNLDENIMAFGDNYYQISEGMEQMMQTIVEKK